MSDSEQVDWPSLMRFGLGVLGLAPQDFWNMTPCELAAATEGRFGLAASVPPLDRAVLDDLVRRFPDDPIPIGGSV